jgi:hypothetical protein
MCFKSKLPIIAVLVSLSVGSGLAFAQSSAGLGAARSSSEFANNFSTGMSSLSRGPSSFGVGASSLRNKPFSTYSAPPTVSPYLNLFRVDLNGNSDFNYSTLVRPQLQQQQTNNQLERQNLQNARRLQSIAAQADFNPQGAKDQYPTGHQTVFGYRGHYFPAIRNNVKRARQQQQ